MIEENKALARKFIRMLETGDPSMVDEIIAVDYTNHDAPNPNIGSEGAKVFVTTFKKAFPDAQAKIAYQIAEGDKVVTRYTWNATHRGEMLGVPATGKQVHWTITTTFKIADGKIQEAWQNSDQLGVMQQLGVVSKPEQNRN